MKINLINYRFLWALLCILSCDFDYLMSMSCTGTRNIDSDTIPISRLKDRLVPTSSSETIVRPQSEAQTICFSDSQRITFQLQPIPPGLFLTSIDARTEANLLAIVVRGFCLLADGAMSTFSSSPTARNAYAELFEGFCNINAANAEFSKKSREERYVVFCEIHHLDVVKEAWEQKVKLRYATLKFEETFKGGVDSFLKSYEKFCDVHYTKEALPNKSRMECYVRFCEFNDARLSAQQYWEKIGKLKYAQLNFGSNADANSFDKSFQTFCEVHYSKEELNSKPYIECFTEFCEVNDAELCIQKYWAEAGKFFSNIDQTYADTLQALRLEKIDETPKAETVFIESFKNFCATHYTKIELSKKSHTECFNAFSEVHYQEIIQFYWEKLGKFKYGRLKSNQAVHETADSFLKSYENFFEVHCTKEELSKISRLKCFDEFCKAKDAQLTTQDYWAKTRKSHYVTLLQLLLKRNRLHTSIDDYDTNLLMFADGGIIHIGGGSGGVNVPGPAGAVIQAAFLIKRCIDLYRSSSGSDGDKDKDKKDKDKNKNDTKVPEKEKTEETREQKEHALKVLLAKQAHEKALKNGVYTGSFNGQIIDLPAVDPQLMYQHSPLQRLLDLSSPVHKSGNKVAIINGKIIRFTEDVASNHFYDPYSISRLNGTPGCYKASIVTDLKSLSKEEKKSLLAYWGFDANKQLEEQAKQQKKVDKKQLPVTNKTSNSGPGQDPDKKPKKTPVQVAAEVVTEKKVKDEVEKVIQDLNGNNNSGLSKFDKNTQNHELIHFSENRDNIIHMFRNKDGKLKDTFENRQRILNMTHDKNNCLGKDDHGNIWYMKIEPDGTQLYAEVRDYIITNCGFNKISEHRVFNETTGLKSLPKKGI